ncbi:MAG TPA: indole-3-glycerol phosphate synthase TrpC [Acidimicrobiales bacterium]|nr:indole-3-glycerol phosphate synthase TrpC [Acidimicrobiales bacterium]
MSTYLDRILESHRERAAADSRDVAALEASAASAPPVRGFESALRAGPRVAVIAEVKRSSPSKGPLNPDLDPAALAAAYEGGGASAISVLTDTGYFGGSESDLRAARGATSLPVLRKDFTVCARDVLDARIMGADAVLLIVAALSDHELAELLGLARSLGLDALVEVHDEREASRALDAGATTVGVNQRDLFTFEVDTGRAARVAGSLPPDVCRVAESGIRDRSDVSLLAGAGFDAVLVGETFVRAAEPAAAVADLAGVERTSARHHAQTAR